MKIFGYEVSISRDETVKAAAGRIPRHPSDTEVEQKHKPRSMVDILPPFGTNPPNRPLTEYDTPLEDRSITNDPRELFYLALPSKLSPSQVTMILRAAQGGDVWQQHQLYLLMQDSWPMFRKCDHELRDAASSVQYVARAYAEEGREPTKQAKEKADLVNRCFKNMKPDRFTDERGFKGMVYHMAGAFTMGLMMEELMWEEPKGGERLLRSAAFVHPRHFTFANDGTLAVFDDNYNRLYFNLAKVGQTPDARKFVCGQFLSPSGSTLGAGFMRPLAWYWSSVVFNREWMARMAQNYGSPFLDVTYRPGTTPQELAALDANIKAGLGNRFIRHIEGTTLNVSPPASLGSDNPQRALAENADRQCQLLMLGQTLSTGTEGGSGSYALGQAHMTVRSDRIEGLAKWIAAEPLSQLAESILMVNYGETSECPKIDVDFSKPMTAMEQAQFLAILGSCPLPVPAEQTYHRMGVAMPEEGDKVLVRGQLGILGDTSQILDPSPEKAQAAAASVVGKGKEHGAGDNLTQKFQHPVPTGGTLPVKSRVAGLPRERVDELTRLVDEAEKSPRLNGEWSRIQEILK